MPTLVDSRTSRRLGALVAFMALCALSGCASFPSMPTPSSLTSWWPPFGWFGGDRKLPPLPEIRDSVITVQWSAGVGNPKLFTFSPSVSDKVIFAAANDGNDDQGTACQPADGLRCLSREGVSPFLAGKVHGASQFRLQCHCPQSPSDSPPFIDPSPP